MALSKTALPTSTKPGTCQRLKTCCFTHNTLFSELQLLPSGPRLQASSCKSNRARNSFIPSAIALYNTQQHINTPGTHSSTVVSAAQWKVWYCVYFWAALCLLSHWIFVLQEHCWTLLCSSLVYFMKDVCHVWTMSWIAFFFLVCVFLLLCLLSFGQTLQTNFLLNLNFLTFDRQMMNRDISN